MSDQSCDFYDIPCHANNLLQGFLELISRIYQSLIDSIIDLIELIPVPDFLSTQFTFPSEISYWLNIAEFSTGITIIVSAYLIRFIIRRIPIIG